MMMLPTMAKGFILKRVRKYTNLKKQHRQDADSDAATAEEKSHSNTEEEEEDHHHPCIVAAAASQQQQQQAQLQEATDGCPAIPLEPTKKKYQVAVFACGCFWNPQRRFQKMHGVKRVIVGYTAGGGGGSSSSSTSTSTTTSTTTTPTYSNMMDYTQALFIEYNPKKVSYRQLLEMWYNNDSPWEPETDHNLRSGIYIVNEAQGGQAMGYLQELRTMRRRQQVGCYGSKKEVEQSMLYVDLEYATTFYQAEEYHQNYVTKQIEAAKRQRFLWLNNQVPSGLYPIIEAE